MILFQYIRWRDIKIEIQCQPLTSTLTPTHMHTNTHSHVCKHVHTHDACHTLKVKHGYCDALVICMIKTSDKTFKLKCDLFYSWSTWILSMTDSKYLWKHHGMGAHRRGISSCVLDKKKDRTSQGQNAHKSLQDLTTHSDRLSPVRHSLLKLPTW